MIRHAATIALLLASTAFAPGVAATEALKLDIVAPAAPVLRPVAEPRLKLNALVEGGTIRLGDLVEDCGDAADLEIAPAPAPGQHLSLDARDIVAFARSKGIAVKDPLPGRQVAISRAARTVSRTMILDRIAEALVAQGVPAEKARQIELSNQALAIKVPVEAEASVLVENVDYDEHSGRFTAIMTTPGQSASVEHVEVAGRLVPTTKVPVPRANLAPGQVIRGADVDWIDMPTIRVGANVVTGEQQVVGQAARRPLRAGAPMIVSDLERPVAVAKGALVNMIVSTPNLSLSAVGKALEGGAIGDTIRLVNPTSNKSVQGIVTAPNEVRIIYGAQIVSANTAAAPLVP